MERKQQYVKIEHQGTTRQGPVISSANYGTAEKPNWYVEFTDEQDGIYYYVKQEIDGMTDAKITFYQVGDEPKVKVVDLLADDAVEQIVANNKEMEQFKADQVADFEKHTGVPTSDTFVLSMLEESFDGSTGVIIAIKYNDGKGYHTTTYGRQTREWLDTMNEKLGVSPARRWAFEICSLFGNWGNYVHTLQMCEEKFACEDGDLVDEEA